LRSFGSNFALFVLLWSKFLPKFNGSMGCSVTLKVIPSRETVFSGATNIVVAAVEKGAQFFNLMPFCPAEGALSKCGFLIVLRSRFTRAATFSEIFSPKPHLRPLLSAAVAANLPASID